MPADRRRTPLVGVQFLSLKKLDLDELQNRTSHLLSRSLNGGKLVAAVGSGVSVNYGYPSWENLEEEVRKETTGSRVTSAPRERNDDDVISRADRMMSRFDEHRENWLDTKMVKDNPTFGGWVVKVMNGMRGKPFGPDPIKELLTSLRVRRFLTSNFDDLIAERMSSRTPRLTFDSSVADLHSFAVGAPGFREGVFHIHGRAPIEGDATPTDVLLSESDYQRVYVREDIRYRGFREALSLTFFANPVLFVGMGMAEPDLLRPLRQFAAEQQRDLRERPLFALLGRPHDDGEAKELWRFLYLRYGIKTLFFGDRDNAREELGNDLVKKIAEVGRDWRQWWDEWQKKPYMRTPSFYVENVVSGGSPCQVMVRHRSEHPTLFQLGGFNRVLQLLGAGGGERRGGVGDGGGRLVLAVGRAGMGKGGLAQAVALGDKVGCGWRRRFFASLHFANDLLSIIDAAARHLGQVEGSQGDRPVHREGDAIERLEATLRQPGGLLVLGGLERLLVPAHETPARGLVAAAGDGSPVERYGVPFGVEATLEFKLLCHMFAALVEDRGLRSDVLLTSSVYPEGLRAVGRWVEDGGAEVPDDQVLVTYLGGNSLENGGAAADHEDRRARAYEALRGHAYLWWLVDTNSREMGDQGSEWLWALLTRLTAVDFQHRPSVVVDAVCQAPIWCVAEGEQDPGASARSSPLPENAVKILELLSACSAPLRVEDISAAWPFPDNHDDVRDPVQRTTDHIQQMMRRGLLFEIRGSSSQRRYTTHSTVRSHFLASQNNLDPPSEVHRFDLAGFSSTVPETLGQPPDIGSLARIAPSDDESGFPLQRLLDRADTVQGDDRARAARAAFAILRGRWTATAIGRPPHLLDAKGTPPDRTDMEWYLVALVRLLNVLRGISAEHGGSAGWRSETGLRADIERSRPEGGALYADELAWVYNELALASACRGAMYDAYALYRMSQDVNIVAEGRSPGHRWCESEIGLALVAIERGQLERACNHLNSALATARRHDDRELEARINGHLAVAFHLRGDLADAEKLYTDALKKLKPTGNRRALALFHRHLADLLRSTGRFDDAEKHIRMSVAAAASGRHHDLVQYATVANAALRLTVAQGGSLQSLVELPRELAYVRRYARRVGLPKLDHDAARVHARLALVQGDLDTAARLALRCLGLSCIHGMELRVTSGLVLMGEVTAARGDNDSARELLVRAAKMAERQNYQSQVSQAQRGIVKLSEAPSDRRYLTIV